MNVKVGSCPDSWGVWFGEDPKQIPWRRFLDEVAEAGYEWIELGPYGYFPQDLNVLRRQLSRRNLKVTGTFLMAHLEDPEAWPGLESQLLEVGELLAGLGRAISGPDRRPAHGLVYRRTNQARTIG